MKMFPSYIWLAACREQGFTELVHQFQAASLLSNKWDIYLIYCLRENPTGNPQFLFIVVWCF